MTPTTDIHTMTGTTPTRHNEQGSIPIAMMLVVFILSATIALGGLLAWQIGSARSEQLNTFSQWALASASAQAVSEVGISGSSLTGIRTAPPAIWTETDAGDYYWRYWVVQQNGGTEPVVAVVTEIKLTSAPGEAQPTSETSFRLVEYLRFDSAQSQWVPYYTVSP